MQSETQLIIKTAGPPSPGAEIARFGGLVTSLVSPQAAFITGDATAYIGKFVNISEPFTPTDWGDFLIINAVYDGSTFTEIFSNVPFNFFGFPTQSSALFILEEAVESLEETYLDLYPLESISQNFLFQDAGTFAPLGDFTREFRIPASDRNVDALGLLDSFTFSDTPNVYGTKIPAEIRVDTLPIMRGHLRVIRTYQRNGMLGDIQVSFYGEAPDLFRAIGDKVLNEVNIMPNISYPINYEYISTGDPLPLIIQWGLVDRGQKWDNTGSEGSRPIFNSELPLYPADFTPFVNAWYILEAIVNDAGFALSPTPLETTLRGYWCPWNNARTIITVEQIGDYYFNAGFSVNTPVTNDNVLTFPQFSDNGGNYSGAYFEAPVEGFYSFRFWANVQPVASFGANTGGIKFFKFTGAVPTAGSIVVNYEVAISGTDQNNGVIQRILFTTSPLYLAAGDRIQPYTEFNGTPIFQGSANNNPLEGTGWELHSYFRNWGDTFNAAANAPNIKQVDFIKDILAMHGAVIAPSRTTPNEVSIIPMIDFIGSGDVIDWTKKLDISKDITLSPTTDIQKRNFLFSYKAGGDFASKLYTDNGRVYGQYQILNGYTVNSSAPPNEFVSGDLNIKLTAESTPASYINGTTIPIPKFINDKGEFTAPNLRFLFLSGTVDLAVYNDATDTVDQTAVNIFNHYSDVNATVGDYDLNFNPESPLHSIITNPYNNLFNVYWRPYLNGLYNPETRILEAFFALELTDILSFKFSDKVFIKDSYWRILEVSDYKVGNFESTKVKLIKIVDPTSDCALLPTNVVIGDDFVLTVEFEDYEGNVEPATEACCVRYGYTWSSILNACIAFGDPVDSDPIGGGRGPAMVFNGENGTIRNVIARTLNTDISQDNTFGVYVGENINIEKGNQNTLAVGERLKLEGANRGTAILGRNAYATINGLHFGAGDRTASAAEGATQAGLVVLTNARIYSAVAQTLELFPAGTAATRLTLPDATSWVCIYTIHASDLNGLFIYEVGSFELNKVGGVAGASTPVIISSDSSGSGLTLTLNIDTATDTDEHRFKLVSGGSGFPYTISANITLHYTQLR